MCRSRVLGRRC